MSRFAFHLSWNPRSPKDMLLYRALRELPHGFSKQVIIRMIESVVGECDDPKQIANALFHFASAKDELARSVIVGGAPLQWREQACKTDPAAMHGMQDAQRTVRANDFVRAAYAGPPPGFAYALVPQGEAPQHPAYPQPTPAARPEPREHGVIVPPAPQPTPGPAPQPRDEGEQVHEHVAARAPAQASFGLMP